MDVGAVEVISDVADDVTSDDVGVVAGAEKDVGVGAADAEDAKVEADEACVVIVAEEVESDIDCGAEVDG